MANKITNTQYYSDIASAIRSKNGSAATYTPAQMAAAIQAIPTGGGDDYLEEYLKNLTGTAEYTNYNVTAVNKPYALYQSPFKKVSLPNMAADGLTRANANYFLSGSQSLQEVNMPNLTVIPANCFQNCAALTTANLGHLTSVGDNAFNGCRQLTFPNDFFAYMTTIGSNAFISCMRLPARIELPVLTKQPMNAFNNNNAITHISMPVADNGNYALTISTCNSQGLIFADYGTWKSFNANVFGVNYALKCIALRKSDAITTLSAASPFGNHSPLKLGQGYILVARDLISTYETATNWSTQKAAGNQFLAIEDYTTDGTTTGALNWTAIDALLA